MQELVRDPAPYLSRRRIAAILAFFALSLAVYLVRIASVWRYGALFCSSGVEFPMIDSVGRAMHHQAVYTSPFHFPFALSLYNYLFYFVYGAVLRLIGAWDAGIMTWGRQLTLLFALAGAWAQWRLVRGHLRLRGVASALSLCLALGLWLCTSLIKYWALTVRPDMAAAALVMIAVWVVVRQPRFAYAYAGILLYLAWAFKQSVIFTVIALCLFLLVKKRWIDLATLSAIFAITVTCTLLMGTPEYRFSILVAPQMVKGFAFGLPWIGHALGTGLNAVLLNIFWVAAPLVVVRSAGGARNVDPKLRPLLVIFALALIAGVISMGKVGGTSNYLFEAFIAGSTLLQVIVFTLPGRLVTALLVIGCIQPALQLTGVAIGYHVTGKRDMVPIATAKEFRAAEALRDRLATMKKPIFSTDGAFALPWFSTENGAPALTIDPNFQEVARVREENGGIEGMLQRGEIPTLLLASTDQIYLKNLNPSYVKVGESIQQGVTYSIYSFNGGDHAPNQ